MLIQKPARWVWSSCEAVTLASLMREIPTPMPYGFTDVMQELRVTPGWALRPECVTILSAAF